MIKALSVPGHVVLRGHSLPLNNDVAKAFVIDCARFTEGLLPEHDLKNKWELSDDAWRDLEENRSVLDAVKHERDRRESNGTAATEAARRHYVKAPSILGDILNNSDVSPRHRIEAAKELRAITTAAVGAGKHKTEKFTVVINLGAGDERVYHLDGHQEIDLPDTDE
jgi:hypothetical protein